ncbi:hypothetical protein Tco_0328420 [Tanacetum coccineum]
MKKGKRDQDSDSFDDEGNAYFVEALVVVRNDEMTELVMDSGDNRTCTIKGTGKVKIQLHDGSSFISKDVRYVPRLKRSLISLGTLEKEGYTVKMQMGRIKVIKGCRVMMTGALETRIFVLLRKQRSPGEYTCEKRVVGLIGGRWNCRELKGIVKLRFQVSNDDAAVDQRQLEEKQLEEKTNTNCLVKEQEKVYLGIKVAENITVTGVPGQEGAEGNVAEKKKTLPADMEAGEKTALMKKAYSTLILCLGDRVLREVNHRIHKDGDGDASFQLKSDSLPHAHAQSTKTFYKHQDSRIMKAQELKTKTSAQTLIYKIFLQRYQVYQGRLLASFQDDAKYEHVGQDTRSQGDNRTCTIKGTGKVKIQLHDGSSFILEDVRYVPGLRRSLISLGTLEKEGAAGYRHVKVLKFFDCPGPRQGVEDLRELLHKGAQGDCEAEVFQVSNNDTAVAQRRLKDKQAEVFQVSNNDTAVAQRRLKDKQTEEKTNTDCLVKEHEKEYQTEWKIKTGNILDSCNQSLVCPRYVGGFFGWLASIKQRIFKPVKVKCIFLGYHKSIVDNKLWRLDDVTSKVMLYMNMGFNESGEYKKTFIGSGVGTASMQVLHGFEFEVEPPGDHTFEVEPQENVDQGDGLQKVQTQDLMDYQLAHDRKQNLACELFRYREDNNEVAFAVAAVEKIYAHESLTFNNTVACEVISKWKAGLKDDTDAQSDVYVLSNSCRKCSDDNDGYYWEYTPAKRNVLGMEIIKDRSGNTLRVSQSRFYNGKLVQTLLEGHSILSLEGSLSGDCDVEKNDVGYGLMILRCAGSLKANLQHIEALSTTEAGYMTFTEAWKKEIWLKGILTESRYELRLVAGIATSALVKGGSRSEVSAQVEVATYRY